MTDYSRISISLGSDNQIAISEDPDKIGISEPMYIYQKTFDEVMTDQLSDIYYGEQKPLFFRGTVRLKKGLNVLRFLYKKGYHTGISRMFRYGFSIIQHENSTKIRYVDQARCTAGSSSTPKQREALINLWSDRPRSLCPDLSKTVSFNISLKKEIVDAISADSEVLGITTADYSIVALYCALLRCSSLDTDVMEEGNRFLTSFQIAIKKRCDDAEECGEV